MQQMFYHSDHIKVKTLDGFKHPSMHTRDVNVLIFLDFSFRYDSVHQKY